MEQDHKNHAVPWRRDSAQRRVHVGEVASHEEKMGLFRRLTARSFFLLFFPLLYFSFLLPWGSLLARLWLTLCESPLSRCWAAMRQVMMVAMC